MHKTLANVILNYIKPLVDKGHDISIFTPQLLRPMVEMYHYKFIDSRRLRQWIIDLAEDRRYPELNQIMVDALYHEYLKDESTCKRIAEEVLENINNLKICKTESI